MPKSSLSLAKAVISIALISYLFGCGEDTPTTPTEYQYTVIDSLFFEKDYDSIYTPFGIQPAVYPIKGKVKKIRIFYDLYSNDTTDSTAYMSFRVNDGSWLLPPVYTPFKSEHWGYRCNGHFEFDHTFEKILDSINYPHYIGGMRIQNGTYLIVRNLKAYKSY